MKVTLTFEIECGDKTCAAEPGKFCKYMKNKMNGSSSCYFFGILFDDETGWIQRHPECLAMGTEQQG